MSDKSNGPARPLIGFITRDNAPQITPAPISRTWMSEITEMRTGWPNRCLPMLVANQSGWELRNRCAFTATWFGQDGVDVKIDRSDLIKEVSIFAERSDIAEEVVRLASHLDQFQVIVNEPESAGRKLEFLTQEMFREANTIGSKASDVEITRRVVEIKSILEKIRELVQNIE